MEKFQSWRNNKTKQAVQEALNISDEIIFFDTETTGFSSTNDRIIEIAAIRVQKDAQGEWVEVNRLHRYIRPTFPIPEKITEITGLNDERLSTEAFEHEVFPEIKAFFGLSPNVVCAHNASFDMRFMCSLYERNGETFIPLLVLDTLEMARDLCHGTSHKLEILAELFGLTDGISFHSALDDTTVTLRLFGIFEKMYNEQSEDVCCKVHPVLESVAYWAGNAIFPRIYVNTDLGTVYYDVKRATWYSKDADLDSIDMNALENEALRLTNCNNLKQFAEFTGKVLAD